MRPNLVDKRIAMGTGTKAVKAASFDGMALAAVTGTVDANEDGEVDDGVQFSGNYKGIPGTVFCGASDCMVEGDEGEEELTGSWYFTPTDGDEWYIGTTADDVTTYSAETLYAKFGHWLSANASDGDLIDVNTYAKIGGAMDANPTDLDVTTVNTGEDDDLTDTSASYSGTAAGMSVEKTTDSDGNITDIQSGAFTAAVDLKATFHADNPTIGGTVSNFDGPAADPNWSVELQTTAFTDAGQTDGRTIATGRDGEWTATGYGKNGERPTGIFGGFNAHFSDGHAAGAYTTRD